METRGSLSPSGSIGSATLAGSLAALSSLTTEEWATSRETDAERALGIIIQALGIVFQQTPQDGCCPLSALGLGAP